MGVDERTVGFPQLELHLTRLTCRLGGPKGGHWTRTLGSSKA